MKKILITGILSIAAGITFAQEIDVKEVERIEKVLASDDMRGRRIATPEIEKAADFICAEFKALGLQTWDGSDSYRQGFIMVRPKFISANATLDGATLDQKNVMVVTCQEKLSINEQSGYALETIAGGGNLLTEAGKLMKQKKSMVVMVDESYGTGFAALARLKRSMFKTDKNYIFIFGNKKPTTYAIESQHEITEQKLANVVGVLPGKSKKNEYVIFSGHYDHIGVASSANASGPNSNANPVATGDSIYNGANDDAAGITAVILLAKYFKELKTNDRTIIFAAFTAEEVGGFGSRYFSNGFNPDKVVAMFNIEMIGTESKWGKNSAYITGYDKSDMGAIMQKSLEGTGFTFHPDPYTDQQLFYRSDNATLAYLGVPAHTISTSKMDSEPNYHKVTDEIGTLDLNNMAQIIKAIALSSKSIVLGLATPSRVSTSNLR
ncbi:MAG TPA: M20/M25/M40 family metallo-hydrolase [Chitinophagaceae bacterium]|nr:M20/M25/M40 family metallo-hydrolase [Chitinophagaceae bacterium]